VQRTEAVIYCGADSPSSSLIRVCITEKMFELCPLSARTVGYVVQSTSAPPSPAICARTVGVCVSFHVSSTRPAVCPVSARTVGVCVSVHVSSTRSAVCPLSARTVGGVFQFTSAAPNPAVRPLVQLQLRDLLTSTRLGMQLAQQICVLTGGQRIRHVAFVLKVTTGQMMVNRVCLSISLHRLSCAHMMLTMLNP
jgi:hypothetical protein